MVTKNWPWPWSGSWWEHTPSPSSHRWAIHPPPLQYIYYQYLQLNADGTPIVESEIISWANNKLLEGGKEISIKHFQDKVELGGLFLYWYLYHADYKDCPPHHSPDWRHPPRADWLQHCQAGREDHWTGKNHNYRRIMLTLLYSPRTACLMLSTASLWPEK